MSSPSALENSEDLENVPLVRMEDVQPPRDRNCDVYSNTIQEEVLETCIVDDIEYGGDCVVNDDEDSNIGSMVSIHSEEVTIMDYDKDTEELIVPELLDTETKGTVLETVESTMLPELKTNPPESWPTLEILPGGVIKNADKYVDGTLYPTVVDHETVVDSNGMMYECAKCSQSFKYLFCLVKHVRWHEDEKKIRKGPYFTKLSKLLHDQKYICLHSGKRKLISKSNTRKTKKS